MTGYLTATEAARALGVSLQTVLRRIDAGQIRAERAGRRMWLIPTGEVERVKHVGWHERQTTGKHDDAAGSALEDAAPLAAAPLLLTRVSVARLREAQDRMRGIRFPVSSTEIVRQEREERSRHLARLHGIVIDEPEPGCGG